MHTNTDEKYRSRVVEIRGSKVYIDYPINMTTDRTVFLLDGMQLKASFTHGESAAFSFETEVRGKVKGNIPMISLLYPGDNELIRIQRRQYVRIETAVDVSIRSGNHLYQTVTDDVSAGGIAFILRKGIQYDKEQELEIMLVLPMKNGENQYLKSRGKYIRTKSRNGIQIGTVKFHDLTSLERQLLIRFTFERQLMIKQKG